MAKTVNNIMIQNARIGFRNFSGEEGRFNPKGRRNFCVFLEAELANTLEKDGWNVRWLEPRNEDEDRQAYMQVAVSYDNRPPNIVLVTKRGKNRLNSDTVQQLDWAEIEKVDLTIRPYVWSVNGKEGIKAYAKSVYVTLVDDELDELYFDTPDSAQNTVGGCGHCDECSGDCKCKESVPF